MEQLQKVKEERSLGDLFSELSKETSTLMRQEVNLAQVEITQKATIVGSLFLSVFHTTDSNKLLFTVVCLAFKY